MELKPGYKQTDVGVIPEDWDVLKVESIIDEISMGPFGSDITVSNFVSSGVPVLSGLNVASERLLDSFENFVTPAKSRSLKKAVAHKGDIVVTHRGTIGQIAYIPEDSEYDRYVVSQSQFRVRFCEDAVIPVWVVLYFHSKNGAKRLLEGKGHTGVPAIAQPTSTFRNLSIPVPPRPEQIAIATALSDVDALLDGLDRLIAKKRDLKQATMQQILTGETRLPGFEGEWGVKRLRQIADVIDPHPSHRAPYEVANGVPFVGIGDLDEAGNIIGSKVRLVSPTILHEHAQRYNLNDDLIGLGRVASIGKVVALKRQSEGYAISPTLGVIRGRDAKRSYLLYALKSRFVTEQFTRIMSGSTRSSVGMEVLRELKILLPKTEVEQTAIAKVLSDMDAEIEALEQRRAKTADLKQAMMQELLTGRTRLV